MSTLTKSLIILLTLSSIFLCGIVVTYVANAENFKQKYENIRTDRDSLNNKAKDLTKQINEKIEQGKQLEEKLTTQLAASRAKIDKIQTDLDNVEREKANLVQKVSNFASLVEGFTQTNDKQGVLLKNTLEELNKLQAEQIKNQKELNETSQALVEKLAIIDTIQSENKRLLEEKTDLQARLDGMLRPTGQVTAAVEPVTPVKSKATEARPGLGSNINLQALITEVDLKNSMASVSIGSADGVKEGMKFHVTRGDEFICDILIIDVDTQESVGILDLVQKQPMVGDNAATNL